jgi:transposase
MAAIVASPAVFRSGRDFSASLGSVPRQDSTGDKVKLGPISKRGNGYLRRLLVNGAMSILNSKRAKQIPGWSNCLPTGSAKWRPSPWPTRWRASAGP